MSPRPGWIPSWHIAQQNIDCCFHKPKEYLSLCDSRIYAYMEHASLPISGQIGSNSIESVWYVDYLVIISLFPWCMTKSSAKDLSAIRTYANNWSDWRLVQMHSDKRVGELFKQCGSLKRLPNQPLHRSSVGNKQCYAMQKISTPRLHVASFTFNQLLPLQFHFRCKLCLNSIHMFLEKINKFSMPILHWQSARFITSSQGRCYVSCLDNINSQHEKKSSR